MQGERALGVVDTGKPLIGRHEIIDLQGKKISRKRRSRLLEIQKLYFVESYTIEEIANRLGLSWASVQKDVALLKVQGKLLAKELHADLTQDITNFIAEIHTNYKTRIKRLWEDYNNCDDEFARVKILKEVRENEKQYIELMQNSGIIHKEPERHLHGFVYVSKLGKTKIDKQEEVKDDKSSEVIDAVM